MAKQKQLPPTSTRRLVARCDEISRKEVPPPGRIGSLFLDSGAFTLYVKNVKLTQVELAKKADNAKDFAYFKTKEFWEYVDAYAAFVKQHQAYVQYYSNVDVIYNPEITWEVQQYLEQEHGLKPVPVVHFRTKLKWIKHYMEHGYDYLGLGGFAQKVSSLRYVEWADPVFDVICDNPKRLPQIKTHGFAVTSFRLLLRYPWYSVDSSSWTKAAAFGQIYMPLYEKGRFVFSRERKPLSITVSGISLNKTHVRRHEQQLKIIKRWLDEINVPLGRVDANGEELEWGVVSNYYARSAANMVFFQRMADSLPKYPWPFKSKELKPFFPDA